MYYKIYYNLESAREYLDVHNAEEQSDSVVLRSFWKRPLVKKM